MKKLRSPLVNGTNSLSLCLFLSLSSDRIRARLHALGRVLPSAILTSTQSRYKFLLSVLSISIPYNQIRLVPCVDENQRLRETYRRDWNVWTKTKEKRLYWIMPMAHIFNHPSMTEIRYKHLRFIVTNSPADENIQAFIEVRQHCHWHVAADSIFVFV